MKILLTSIVLLSGLLSFTPSTSALDLDTKDKTAYICNGPYSKKYHYRSDCRGLSNCSTEIETTTVSKAKEKGRGLCGWED